MESGHMGLLMVNLMEFGSMQIVLGKSTPFLGEYLFFGRENFCRVCSLQL